MVYRAKQCIRDISDTTQPGSPPSEAAGRAVTRYLSKTVEAPVAYQDAKHVKLLALARKANVGPHVLQLLLPHLSPARLAGAALTDEGLPDIVASLAARQDAAAVRVHDAAQARCEGRLWDFYRGLMQLGGAAPLDEDTRRLVSDWLERDLAAGRASELASQIELDVLSPWVRHDFSAALLRILTRHTEHVSTLLPHVKLTDELRISPVRDVGSTLAWLGLWQRDVNAWLRIDDRYVFFTDNFAGAQASREALTYQLTSSPYSERLGWLAQLGEMNQELAALNIDAAGTTLHALVRSRPPGMPACATRLLAHVARQPDLHDVNQRTGYVCGYVRRKLGPYSDAAASVEHVFAVIDDGQRYVHAVWPGVSMDALQMARVAMRQAGWQLCAVAPDGLKGYLAIVRRALAVEPALRLQGPAFLAANIVASTRARVLTYGDAEAMAALQTLVDAQARFADEKNPWFLCAKPLLRAFAARSTSAWQALAEVAQLAADPGAGSASERAFSEDMQSLLTRWCTRLLEGAPPPAVVQAAWEHKSSLSTAALGCLNRALSKAVGVDGLQAAIDLQHVGAAALLAALSSDNFYAAACATGNPCLADAVDANAYAAEAWQRMSNKQRTILCTLGKAAWTRSADAAAALNTRIGNLGFDASTLLPALRRYLRRDADLWINFKPGSQLLRAIRYIPNSGARTELERKRFVQYCDGQTPKDEYPIYAFLNADKATHGFSKFGHAALILHQNVRARVTLVARQHHSAPENFGTLHALDHVLLALDDATLRRFVAGSQRNRQQRIWLRETGIQFAPLVEAHIHGPVDIGRDTRKVVASVYEAPTPRQVIDLKAFAQHHGLPLRWRGQVTTPGTGDGDIKDVLDLASTLGLDLATWITVKGRGQSLNVRHSADGHTPSPWRYDLLRVPMQQLQSFVADLGQQGADVAVLRVDEPTQATAIVRFAVDRVLPKILSVRRSFSLQSKLKQLEMTGWHVTAYTEVRVPESPTPHHHFVTQYSPLQPYEHAVVPIAQASVEALENSIAHHKQRGWGLVSLAKSSRDAATNMLFKRPLQRALPPLPTAGASYRNSTTLIEDDSIDTVPEDLLFVDADGYAFDIDELTEAIEVRGTWTNPYTNAAFSAPDVSALLAHPSGAGAVIATRLQQEGSVHHAITVATAQRVQALGGILEQDDPKGALDQGTNAIADFQSYVATLPAAEQLALFGARFALRDTHGADFKLSVMQALVGVQTHTGCSRATGRYLQSMASSIAPT